MICAGALFFLAYQVVNGDGRSAPSGKFGMLKGLMNSLLDTFGTYPTALIMVSAGIGLGSLLWHES